MSRLAPVPADADFIDMEVFIHDAADMADAIDDIVMKMFSKAPENGVHRVNREDGHQALFLAGLAVEMARKVEDAYRIAHANHFAKKGGAA